MAPMVTQDSIDFSSFLEDDFLHLIDTQVFDQTDFAISSEEIQNIAETFPDYDNTKLMENNGVSVGLPVPPCAVVVQAASPDPDLDLTQILDLEPVSPEMFLPQSVSTGPSVESALSPYSYESFTSNSDFLQPTTPEPFSVQPASPDQHYMVAYSPQPSSLEAVELNAEPLPSVEPVVSPYSVQLHIKEEATPIQSLDVVPDAPKKRGRKRKYPEGAAPRRSRSKKTKVYEMGPLLDEKEEKKRRNAINAKRHRDMQKNERNLLAQQLQVITAERDSLLKKVQQLMQSEAQLKLRLASQGHQNNTLM